MVKKGNNESDAESGGDVNEMICANVILLKFKTILFQ